MENKTTTELLELLYKVPEEGEKGYDEFWVTDGKYRQIMEELKSREPFLQILGDNWDESIPALWEVISELRKDIKLLKRHKHDEKSGDVMARI